LIEVGLQELRKRTETAEAEMVIWSYRELCVIYSILLL